MAAKRRTNYINFRKLPQSFSVRDVSDWLYDDHRTPDFAAIQDKDYHNGRRNSVQGMIANLGSKRFNAPDLENRIGVVRHFLATTDSWSMTHT